MESNFETIIDRVNKLIAVGYCDSYIAEELGLNKYQIRYIRENHKKEDER